MHNNVYEQVDRNVYYPAQHSLGGKRNALSSYCRVTRSKEEVRPGNGTIWPPYS